MSAESKGWFVDYDHAGKVIGVASPDREHDLELVASVRDEAAAHLLSAAPDLLAALENIVDIAREYYDMDMGPNGSAALEQADAAIAKAKGGQP